MATDKQASANKANAKKSTGPKTAAGKAMVSGNAIAHGILSKRLLLSDESPDDFQALQDGLRQSLGPVGALELALVEKVAVALWKQRRMVGAESAAIELDKADKPDDSLDYLLGLKKTQTIAEAKLEAERVNTMRSAPFTKELMMRYQVALDSELYRAMDALRKQQEWRIKSGMEIEAEVVS
jgi:hypothetical protein